jgi:phytoene synthase
MASAALEPNPVIGYTPPQHRAALEALFALDATLATILRTPTQPIIGQMRLACWYEALTALDTAPAPANPVLRALQTEVLPHGVTGRAIAAIVDGWEALLDTGPLGSDRLSAYAAGRGAGIFAAAGAVLGSGAADPVGAAGEGWALADLVAHLRDGSEVTMARAAAERALAVAFAIRWSRAGRALGALALLARADLAGIPPRSPRRAARLLRFQITGH